MQLGKPVSGLEYRRSLDKIRLDLNAYNELRTPTNQEQRRLGYLNCVNVAGTGTMKG
jgi:hypothetical protein